MTTSADSRAPERVSEPPIWAPLRVASYRYLFVGQTTSLLGDQFLVVALPFVVLGRGGGATALGQVLAAYGTARVLALPVGGWLGDHRSRRGVMIASDVVRGLLVLALLSLTASRSASTISIALAVATIGLAEGVFMPSSFAILPGTVPAELLSRANALSGGSQNLALLVGPGLGGLLAAGLSPTACLVVDAGTFAVSATTLLAVHERAVPDDLEGSEASPATFRRFLLTSRLLQIVIVLTVISNLAYFGMLEVALPILSADVLKTGTVGFGMGLAGFGFGSFMGGFLIVRLERLRRRGTVAIALGAAQGVLFAAVALVHGLAPVVLLMALAGVTNGVLNVFYLSRVQEKVPGALLGRAMSALMLAVFAVHPLSVAAAAGITNAYGPETVFATAGLSIVAAFALGAGTRTYRGL